MWGMSSVLGLGRMCSFDVFFSNEKVKERRNNNASHWKDAGVRH